MARHPRSQRKADLAAFLRSRRERLAPADVGLARTGRRRTPGLRREEVAHVAGVGVTWYTWLEQGREIDVSVHFLERIAKALRLSANERAHLFTLAHDRPPPTTIRPSVDVTPALRRMLESIEGPAYLATPSFDVLAWNTSLSAIFGSLDHLPAHERNMLWLMFTDFSHRATIPNWEEAAKGMLARFRVQFGRDRDDVRFAEIIDALNAASDEFRAWWPKHDVNLPDERPKRFTAAPVGELALDQNTFQVELSPGTRLVVYSPADPESARKVAILRRRWLAKRRQKAIR